MSAVRHPGRGVVEWLPCSPRRQSAGSLWRLQQALLAPRRGRHYRRLGRGACSGSPAGSGGYCISHPACGGDLPGEPPVRQRARFLVRRRIRAAARTAACPSSVTLSDGTEVTPGHGPERVPEREAQRCGAQVREHPDGGAKMNGWRKSRRQLRRADGLPVHHRLPAIAGAQPDHPRRQFAISDDTFSLADSPVVGRAPVRGRGQPDGFSGNNPCARKGTRDERVGLRQQQVSQWISPAGKQSPSRRAFPTLACPPASTRRGGVEATRSATCRRSWTGWTGRGCRGRFTARRPGTEGYSGRSAPRSPSACTPGRIRTWSRRSLPGGRGWPGSAGLFGGHPRAATASKDSCHNVMSMTACDNRGASLVQCGGEQPGLGRTTAVFITFDDCGGFYDQVPRRKQPRRHPERPAHAGASSSRP